MCDCEDLIRTRFIVEHLNIPEADALNMLKSNDWDIAKILEEHNISPKLDHSDIVVIMDQAGVDYDTARNALVSAGGDPVDALMSIDPLEVSTPGIASENVTV